MNINKIRDEVAELVRSNKESWLAQLHDPNPSLGDTDVRNMVHGFRGEDPVVMLMPFQTDRDKTLYAAQIAAVGFGCDVIAFSTESWHPVQEHIERNPYTGKGWHDEERSMQKAVEENNALEEGVISEALTTMVVNRAGDTSSVMQDYKISKEVNALGIATFHVEWSEPVVMESMAEGVEIQGIVPEALVFYMNLPTVVQSALQDRTAAGLAAELGPERTQAHVDCATVKFIYRQAEFEGAVILMSNSEVRNQVIQESLGEMGYRPRFPWGRDD